MVCGFAEQAWRRLDDLRATNRLTAPRRWLAASRRGWRQASTFALFFRGLGELPLPLGEAQRCECAAADDGLQVQLPAMALAQTLHDGETEPFTVTA